MSGDYDKEVIESINSIYRLLNNLTKEVNSLKSQYAELSNRVYNDSEPKSEPNSKPQFYSISKENNEGKPKPDNKEVLVETKLNESAELLVLDFRKHPPKRK
jgi:uncharacterized membrane-anchored protein YhcB (DUF1043 family)